MVAITSSGPRDIPRLVAIRYLGTILALETFWENERYDRHFRFAIGMFKTFASVLEDIGLAPGVGYDMMDRVAYDDESVDCLIEVTVAGVHRWMEGGAFELPMSDTSLPWYRQFMKLVLLIRRYTFLPPLLGIVAYLNMMEVPLQSLPMFYHEHGNLFRGLNGFQGTRNPIICSRRQSTRTPQLHHRAEGGLENVRGIRRLKVVQRMLIVRHGVHTLEVQLLVVLI